MSLKIEDNLEEIEQIKKGAGDFREGVEGARSVPQSRYGLFLEPWGKLIVKPKKWKPDSRSLSSRGKGRASRPAQKVTFRGTAPSTSILITDDGGFPTRVERESERDSDEKPGGSRHSGIAGGTVSLPVVFQRYGGPDNRSRRNLPGLWRDLHQKRRERVDGHRNTSFSERQFHHRRF